MAGRGRRRDAHVTTHLLVALDKARREGGGGGRKRRANRYYYSSVEQGEAHAARRLKQPPPLMRSFRKRCQHADGVCGKVIHLHRILGWTGRLRKATTDKRHSAPLTVTHGDMLQQRLASASAEQLRPNREAQNTSGV